LVFRKVNAMLRLGMTLRASEDLPSLEAIAGDQKSPALAADTLLLILRLDAAMGSAERQGASFQRVRSLVESDAGVALGPNFRTKGLLALAEARLRANDPADGEQWAVKALALQQRDDGAPATKLGTLARTLKGISLLQRGRAVDALQSLHAAQDDCSKLFGPDNPTTYLFSLNTALALETLGRWSDALTVVARAEPALRKAMGADAPTYLRAKALRNRLEQHIESEGPSHPGAEPFKADVSIGRRPVIDFFS
jgi:hypothetical protein